jgi:DHA2 family multidrug resistance protein
MGMLKKNEIGNASGIYNLMRNIGGSIGIAMVTTNLVRGAQTHQNYLAANLTAGDPTTMAFVHGLQAKIHMGGASAAAAQHLALGAVYRSLQQQSSLMAYADNFQSLAFLSLLCIPPILFLRRLHKRSRRGDDQPEH